MTYLKNEYFVSSTFKDSLFAVNQSLMFTSLLFTTVKMCLMSIKYFSRAQFSGGIFLDNNFSASFFPRDIFPDIHRSASEFMCICFLSFSVLFTFKPKFYLDVFRSVFKLSFMSTDFPIVDINFT